MNSHDPVPLYWQIPAYFGASTAASALPLLANIPAYLSMSRSQMPASWYKDYDSHLSVSKLRNPPPDLSKALKSPYLFSRATMNRTPIDALNPQLESQFLAQFPHVAEIERVMRQEVKDRFLARGQARQAARLVPSIYGGDVLRLFNAQMEPFRSTPYVPQIWDIIQRRPHLFGVSMLGVGDPGVVAHEAGHLVNAPFWGRWSKILRQISMSGVPATRWLSLPLIAMSPNPETAAIPALAHLLVHAPLLREELAASWAGGRLLAKAMPHLGWTARLKPFVGMPGYLASAVAPPLIGMAYNIWSGRAPQRDAYDQASALLQTAGIGGLTLRHMFLGPAMDTLQRTRYQPYLAATYNLLGNPLRLFKPSSLLEKTVGFRRPVHLLTKPGLPGLLLATGLGMSLGRRLFDGAGKT